MRKVPQQSIAFGAHEEQADGGYGRRAFVTSGFVCDSVVLVYCCGINTSAATVRPNECHRRNAFSFPKRKYMTVKELGWQWGGSSASSAGERESGLATDAVNCAGAFMTLRR